MKQYYEVVSVEDELPKESGEYLCVNPKIKTPFAVYFNFEQGTFELGSMSFFVRTSGITHWLRPVTGIIMSKEEGEAVNKVIEDAKIYTETYGDASVERRQLVKSLEALNQLK